MCRYQTIPLSKIEDFGVHANQYYSLDITFFKSSLDSHMLDLLWNKYGGEVWIYVYGWGRWSAWQIV